MSIEDTRLEQLLAVKNELIESTRLRQQKLLGLTAIAEIAVFSGIEAGLAIDGSLNRPLYQFIAGGFAVMGAVYSVGYVQLRGQNARINNEIAGISEEISAYDDSLMAPVFDLQSRREHKA